jgi:hypothetical protein
VPRDLSTALLHRGRLWLLFEPRDLWIGVYVAPRAVYLGVPFLVLKWERRPR